MSARQKDFFVDILDERHHTSDIGWALRHREVPAYKYNKPRSSAEIKKHVLESDRVKYAVEKVSDLGSSTSMTVSDTLYYFFGLWTLLVLFSTAVFGVYKNSCKTPGNNRSQIT